MNTSPHRQRAFTLIELMVVLAIMGLLTALSIPAYHRIVSSLDMSNAGQLLVAQLDSARQEALANNRTVVIRIYKVPDRDSTIPVHYRALQTFASKDDGTLAATGKVIYLPDTITLADDVEQSPLLSLVTSEIKTPGDTDPDLPNIGKNYRYISLRFRGNGQLDPKPQPLSTDAGKWYMTLCKKQPAGKVTNPGDFITVSLDPTNGRTTTYRP